MARMTLINTTSLHKRGERERRREKEASKREKN
jgi:hypothetical protein